MLLQSKQIPAFQRLKQHLLSIVKDSKPGDKVPSIRALRQQFKLSQATIDKALFEMEAGGYIYRSQGRGTFVRDKSEDNDKNIIGNGLIALVVPYINVSSFFADIVRGIECEAFKFGYKMLLCTSRLDKERNDEHIKDFMNDDNIRGVIYVSSDSGEELTDKLNALSAKKPLTIVDVALEDLTADYVTTNDKSGAFEAVDYLIKQGHSKIAFLTAERTGAASTLVNRFAGYKEALAKNRIKLDDSLIIKAVDCEIGFGHDAMQNILAKGFNASALFCASDDLATGAMEAFFEYGVKIPADLSVVGFGGLDFNNPYRLSLTTVTQPAEEMGRKAITLINERLKGKRLMNSFKEVIMPTRLRIGETCNSL